MVEHGFGFGSSDSFIMLLTGFQGRMATRLGLDDCHEHGPVKPVNMYRPAVCSGRNEYQSAAIQYLFVSIYPKSDFSMDSSGDLRFCLTENKFLTYYTATLALL
jgi:hypothetical protein